jgi:hypothetical protein
MGDEWQTDDIECRNPNQPTLFDDYVELREVPERAPVPVRARSLREEPRVHDAPVRQRNDYSITPGDHDPPEILGVDEIVEMFGGTIINEPMEPPWEEHELVRLTPDPDGFLGREDLWHFTASASVPIANLSFYMTMGVREVRKKLVQMSHLYGPKKDICIIASRCTDEARKLTIFVEDRKWKVLDSDKRL